MHFRIFINLGTFKVRNLKEILLSNVFYQSGESVKSRGDAQPDPNHSKIDLFQMFLTHMHMTDLYDEVIRI